MHIKTGVLSALFLVGLACGTVPVVSTHPTDVVSSTLDTGATPPTTQCGEPGQPGEPGRPGSGDGQPGEPGQPGQPGTCFTTP